MTLRQARINFVRTGVCDGTSTQYVRPPTIVEVQLHSGEEITPKGST